MLTLVQAARADARDIMARTNPGEFHSQVNRLKWLARLPDDYDFATSEYRWTLSDEQRSALPAPQEGPRAELIATERRYDRRGHPYWVRRDASGKEERVQP